MSEVQTKEAEQSPQTVQEQTPETPAKKAELVVGDNIRPIVPRSVEELHRMAHGVVLAGLVPNSYAGRNDQETIQRVSLGIQKSLEVGLPPLTGLSTIMIINNRPSIWGDGAIALIQSKGVVEWTRHRYEGEEGTDNFKCVFEIKRKGQEEPYVGEFSMADAKKAKLTNKTGPWMTYPKRMLFNRARAFPLRDGFADCLCGLAIAEEMQDVETPAETVDTSFLDDDDQNPQDEVPTVERVSEPARRGIEQGLSGDVPTAQHDFLDDDTEQTILGAG